MKKAEGSAEIVECEEMRAVDSMAKAEELHRKALVECETACLDLLPVSPSQVMYVYDMFYIFFLLHPGW